MITAYTLAFGGCCSLAGSPTASAAGTASLGGTDCDASATTRWNPRFPRARVPVSKPFHAVHAAPAHPAYAGRLLLLSFTGRNTGKRFTIPISFALDSDGSLLLPGGGAWKLNLQTGRSVEVRLRGKDRLAQPELVWEPSEIERLLPNLFKGNPRAETFVGVPLGSDGKPDQEKLKTAVEEGFAIVRLRLMS